MSDVQQLVEAWAKREANTLPEMIAAAIRDRIAAGQLLPGQRLPSEPEFAATYRVSRNTLRDALGILTKEGLVVRRHGRGTFVNQAAERALHGGLAELTSTSELIRRHGYVPGTVGLSVTVGPTEPRICEVFEAAGDTPFLHVTRTRLASGVPVIHCEEYLPAGAIEPPAGLEHDDDWSLYNALRAQGMAPSFANCKVRPIVADRQIAKRLRLKAGQPLLLLEQTHYSADGRPVLYCDNWHNSGLIEFALVRRG
jgi:GntR family transcriptional regulator